ncbi:MAG TPA: beta-N-acetylhexosaminidase, partial [Gemmatimonadaceae bacterium]|nr:beta-N-acetylhexosaminidase [Gemmatimonadaceae bacterium]
MRVIGSLQDRMRVMVVATALIGAGCAPKPVTTPQPVARPPQLVPAPVSLTYNAGPAFALQHTSNIVVDAGNADAAAIGEQLAALLRAPTGYPVNVVSGPATPGAIVLRLNSGNPTLGTEGYQLTVTADSVRVIANGPAGLFYGTQTIRQLLPVDIESEIGVDRNTWSIPALAITDYPRFAWRGAMLDVARHFFTPREVDQYIDLLAMYKMNTLHLHLADDQGWRIQLTSRPRLTEVGSQTQVGGGPGGFYTQQEYRDIIRYAAARYITIVPEIEMPGHSTAAIKAYPQFACGCATCANSTPSLDITNSNASGVFCAARPETREFLHDILTEVMDLFPGPYIHIGGDEVNFNNWQQHSLDQQLMSDLGITSYQKYQSYFTQQIADFVKGRGRTMIGWSE